MTNKSLGSGARLPGGRTNYDAPLTWLTQQHADYMLTSCACGARRGWLAGRSLRSARRRVPTVQVYVLRHSAANGTGAVTAQRAPRRHARQHAQYRRGQIL